MDPDLVRPLIHRKIMEMGLVFYRVPHLCRIANCSTRVHYFNFPCHFPRAQVSRDYSNITNFADQIVLFQSRATVGEKSASTSITSHLQFYNIHNVPSQNVQDGALKIMNNLSIIGMHEKVNLKTSIELDELIKNCNHDFNGQVYHR